jgi:hypothetical protein
VQIVAKNLRPRDHGGDTAAACSYTPVIAQPGQANKHLKIRPRAGRCHPPVALMPLKCPAPRSTWSQKNNRSRALSDLPIRNLTGFSLTADPAIRHEPRKRDLSQRQENSQAYCSPSVFISRKGLTLPQRMSFDNWMGIGRQLSSICSSSAWCLGDWLVFGEATFSGRYREAIEQTSLDYQTLRNYAWVVRRFSLSRRRDTLSFAHHAEVAALPEPEQDFWLCKAEELAWSVKRLRREVQTSLRERSTSDDGEGGHSGAPNPGSAEENSTPGIVMLKVSIPANRLEACNWAASKCDLKLEEWAGQVLTRAALRDDIAAVLAS